jgi:pentatricopeptide repeat protein
LILVAGVFVFASNSPDLKKLQWWHNMSTEDADNLVKQGKYEEALYILQDLKAKGKLTKSQNDTYSRVCVKLAQQYAHDKRYDDAINLLEPIARSSKEAQNLLKRYKQIDH